MNVNARLIQYTTGAVRVAAGDRQQQRDRRAERGDLRQREIDEDHAALDDVDAEIGVNAGQDQAGGEGRRQKLRACRVPCDSYFAPLFLMALTSRLMS